MSYPELVQDGRLMRRFDMVHLGLSTNYMKTLPRRKPFECEKE
jgi:hypothetical protein